MNIKNFDTLISKTILKRGYDYFRKGQVVSLLEYKNLKFKAQVEGTYNYSVTVNINEEKEIIKSTCNCPFDWGNFCKHEAAVFYALQASLNDEEKNIGKEGLTLKQFLKNKSKEEIIQLILKVSYKNNLLYPQLLEEQKKLEYSIESTEKNIQYYIDLAKTNDVINSSKVLVALEGVYLTLDHVKLMLKNSQYRHAIEFSSLCLKHTLKYLSSAEDTSGEIKAIIERILSYIEEATRKGIKEWTSKEKNIVFKEIMNEASQKGLDGGSDWHYSLLKTSVYFCSDKKLRRELSDVLESLIEPLRSESWEDKYYRGKLKEIQLKIISQNDDIEAYEEFLLVNLSDSNIRDQAILYSLKNKYFQQELQLKIDHKT